MKNLLILMIVGLLFGSCCKDCDQPQQTPEEKQTALLTNGTWKMQNLLHDGVDESDLWDGFQATFDTNHSYSTTNSNDATVWPENGTWGFLGSEGVDLDVIIRNDGIMMDISNFTPADMTLTFIIDPPATVKINGLMSVNHVDGEYVFRLTR